MLLKFKGGIVKKAVVVDGKRQVEEENAKSYSQFFEQTEYTWPKVGSVLSVSDPIGSWLLGKSNGLLEQVHGKEAGAPTHPRQIMAVVPQEEAPPPPAPAAVAQTQKR